MYRLILLILYSLLANLECAYNPIPIGSVVVSTTTQILVLKPTEYGGKDERTVIYTASSNMTIVSTIYDPAKRNLYVLFTNSAYGPIYLRQLVSLELLSTTIYELPIMFNTSRVNDLVSFTGDIINRRGFYTNQLGEVKLFSMSGLMQSNVTIRSTESPVRSVAYANVLNRLFIVTDTQVESCLNLDTDNLQCCRARSVGTELRSIAFDQVSGDFYAYVLDKRSGIYQVALNSTGCPTALRAINAFGSLSNLHFVIDRGLYFASASLSGQNDNSFLMIANGTQEPRRLSIYSTIVALHISNPNVQNDLSSEETCFHGITYSDYRAAVVLAAIFGTIMGIFMCFNALFCIDFFMTKRIIRNLKSQIPHDLLEDRWNKLVEEKYAKIALEKQRKKDDPPPRRQSSLTNKQTATSSNTTNTSANGSTIDSLQVPNPIPKISAYIRRKSESYLSRRRSDDYRSQRHHDLSDGRTHAPRYQHTTAQVHIAPLKEEQETTAGLRQNLSRKQLLMEDDDFL